jgi:hypothetical protein
MTETINELSQVSETALSNGDHLWQIILILMAGAIAIFGGMAMIFVLKIFLSRLAPAALQQPYVRVIVASKNSILILLTLSVMEIVLALIPKTEWLSFIEFFLGVGITILRDGFYPDYFEIFLIQKF